MSLMPLIHKLNFFFYKYKPSNDNLLLTLVILFYLGIIVAMVGFFVFIFDWSDDFGLPELEKILGPKKSPPPGPPITVPITTITVPFNGMRIGITGTIARPGDNRTIFEVLEQIAALHSQLFGWPPTGARAHYDLFITACNQYMISHPAAAPYIISVKQAVLLTMIGAYCVGVLYIAVTLIEKISS